MWKLKIAEGHGPYLFTTNNFVGRQIWEFDPNAGTPEERAAVEQARKDYKKSCKTGGRARPCADLLMRMQVIHTYQDGENGNNKVGKKRVISI